MLRGPSSVRGGEDETGRMKKYQIVLILPSAYHLQVTFTVQRPASSPSRQRKWVNFVRNSNTSDPS